MREHTNIILWWLDSSNLNWTLYKLGVSSGKMGEMTNLVRLRWKLPLQKHGKLNPLRLFLSWRWCIYPSSYKRWWRPSKLISPPPQLQRKSSLLLQLFDFSLRTFLELTCTSLLQSTVSDTWLFVTLGKTSSLRLVLKGFLSLAMIPVTSLSSARQDRSWSFHL